MKKVKYGIIGCGKHALQSHAILTKDSPTLELVALCDLSKKQMKNFESEYGKTLTKFSSEEAMLNSPGINAVLIGTPDDCHTASIVKAIEAGKHVFAEKPLATNIPDLKRIQAIIEKAQKKKLVLTSCHPRRYDPPFLWLKRNLPEFISNLGPVFSFEFDFSYHKPSKLWKHNRGLLMDHANHEIDLLHFLLGYPKFFKAIKLIDSFDRYKITGWRDDGITFAFSGTRCLETKKYDEFVTIRFEKGLLFLSASYDGGIAVVKTHDTRSEKTYKSGETNYDIRFKDTTENFGQAILNQAQNYLTSDDLYINTALSVVLTRQESWMCKVNV